MHTHMCTHSPTSPSRATIPVKSGCLSPILACCPCLALLQARGLEGLGSVPALRSRTQGDTRPTGRRDSSCQGRAGQEGRKGVLRALLPATVQIQCLPGEPDNVGLECIVGTGPQTTALQQRVGPVCLL